MAKAIAMRMMRKVLLLRVSITCLTAWQRPAFTARWSVAWKYGLPKSCDNCASAIARAGRTSRKHFFFAPRANPDVQATWARYTRPVHFLAGWQHTVELTSSRQSFKGNMVQVNLARTITTCACALALALTLLPVAVQAQPATPAATQAASGAAPAAIPAADQKPGDVAAPAPKKAAEVSDNPYGLESLWKSSDVVAKTVLLLLLIMSVGSWYILIVKVLEQAKMSRQAKAVIKNFWPAATVAQGAATLDTKSPYRFMADAALNAVKKHDGLMGHVDLNEWIATGIHRAVERIQSRTQNGLAFLATVGSISPFVGLFGTVWGIYHALTAIGISGQASIDKVAGPVGEALLMTAIGLAVAVPAVLSYNWLVRRNKAVMDDVRAFSSDLHAVVLGSVKRATGS